MAVRLIEFLHLCNMAKSLEVTGAFVFISSVSGFVVKLISQL